MVAIANRKPLGQLLLDRGLLRPEQLQKALDEKQRSGNQKLLGEVLVELRILTEEQVAEALAGTYGLPFVRVSPRFVDPKCVPLLPREFLEQGGVLPLFLVEGTLTVAVSEPSNLLLLEEVERLTGHVVQVVAATAKDIGATLQTYLPDQEIFVIDEIIEEVRPEDFSFTAQKKVEDITDLEQQAADSPVVKLVNYCIYSAVREGASDIHVEPDEGALRVRFRIDGRLVERLRPPHQMAAAVASRVKIMAGLDIAERRVPQDGGIHVVMEKKPIDLRVSTMPGRSGEKVVVRVIDNDKASVNLEKLGFGYETLKTWRRLINLPNGILLVTGPTGSGKSTTLYASLGEIAAEDTNTCTVEDPVEFKLTGINQFQVNDKAGFTFAAALRALLRQDPDVIMVGEVRDSETAKLAVQAALTGHLVLSTLHTNDAPGAVTRLTNLEVEPYLVGATVAGVLAQRLVRKLCVHCREATSAPPNTARLLGTEGKPFEGQIYKPKGCDKCRGLGYAGRVGVYELMEVDDRLADLIAANAPLNELRAHAKTTGMPTLRADGLDKVRAGLTTMDEVASVAV